MADRLVVGQDQDAWFALVAERRHDLAGYLLDLPDERWRMPSLCGGWTVREVAGHLVTPMLMSVPRIGWEIVKSGLSFDRGMDRLARRFAQLPTVDLAETIADHADDRFTAPRYGAEAPLADAVIHTLDIRWSLDARAPVPEAAAAAVLDFLVSGQAKVWAPTGLSSGLRWTATDVDWAHGADGVPAVQGPADALLCVLSGRRAGLDDVSGSGVDTVSRRLSR